VWLQTVHANRLLPASELNHEKFTSWPNYFKRPDIGWRQWRTAASSLNKHRAGQLQAPIRGTRDDEADSSRGDDEDAYLVLKSAGLASSLEASSPGNTRGWLKTASIEDILLTSFGAARRPSRAQRWWAGKSTPAPLARSASFSCRCVRPIYLFRSLRLQPQHDVEPLSFYCSP
jgi:hypothetical protein